MADIFVAPQDEKNPSTKTNKEVEVVSPENLPRGVARHGIHGHTHNPIAAFNYYPDHANFSAADNQEKIILILRQHPVTNLKWIIVATLMLLSPVAVSFFPGINIVPMEFQLVIMMMWYLITMAFVIEEFLTWYFNVNVITDERIFDVDFVNLIYREITDANIDQIQDVTVQMGGVARTMLNFGDIVIQTAAEIPQIEFKAVPKPDAVASILRELRVEEEQEKLEGRAR